MSWAAADNEPDILGDTALVTSAAMPQRVLAFGTWLEPDKAQAMERAVDALRASGEGFSMPLMTLSGDAVEAEGRAIGGRAVLRLRDVSGLKRELAELNARHEKLAGDVESLRTLIDALPSPVWARDIAGSLVFANPAYARAVEAKDAADALARDVELLEPFGARRGEPSPRRRARPMSGACRRSSQATAAASTCSTCRPARAAPASASTRPKPRRCAPSSSGSATRIAARSTSSRPASRSSPPTSA